MCLRYAQLETKLGEIDRARGIYSHGSQFSDPRVSIVIDSRLKVCGIVMSLCIDIICYRQLNHIGRHGKNLKYVMAMKIHSERCLGLKEVYRHCIIHRYVATITALKYIHFEKDICFFFKRTSMKIFV